MRGAAIWLVALLAGCGGDVDSDGTGGGAGAGGSAGGGGTATGGQGGAAGSIDGGWEACSTPEIAVCGPGCPDKRPGCSVCLSAKDEADFGICGESITLPIMITTPHDGEVLVTTTETIVPEQSGALVGLPFAFGVFLAQQGQAGRVAYADRGVFTSEPIPAPTSCPSLAVGQVCGGYCGGCPIGLLCTGRSPLHPYGICVPDNDPRTCRYPAEKGHTCKSAEACFIFTVEAERQPLANRMGFCMPKELCEAYRTLPGGAECR